MQRDDLRKVSYESEKGTNDGVFHQWFSNTKGYLRGLVEDNDGKVHEIAPNNITFLDAPNQLNKNTEELNLIGQKLKFKNGTEKLIDTLKLVYRPFSTEAYICQADINCSVEDISTAIDKWTLGKCKILVIRHSDRVKQNLILSELENLDKNVFVIVDRGIEVLNTITSRCIPISYISIE